MKSILGAVVAFLMAGGAARAQTIETGQVTNAFVLELHVGTAQTFISTGGSVSSDLLAFNGTSGGLFVGGKIGRVILGGSIDALRVATSNSGAGIPETSTSQTAILFLPGVRVDLVRSPDGKVDAFGEIDFGVGHTFVDTGSSMSTDQSNYRIVYQIGPGVRFWPHPRMAVGAVGGLRGDFFSVSSSSSMIDRSQGFTSVFGALQMLGAF